MGRLAARIDDLQRQGHRIDNLSPGNSLAVYVLAHDADEQNQTPNEGAAAMTTVEARGTSSSSPVVAVSDAAGMNAARAHGAQLTVGRTL